MVPLLVVEKWILDSRPQCREFHYREGGGSLYLYQVGLKLIKKDGARVGARGLQVGGKGGVPKVLIWSKNK
jgi:hypothetical protein